ncbi:MAG: thioredoxin family protein [Actinomycetota bacterium]
MEGVPCLAGGECEIAKRQVEVFTAGCPVCEPAVELVQDLACPDCEVTVHDLRNDPSAAESAGRYGIARLPAVAVNGTLVSCCQTSSPSRDELSAAGIGQRL